MWIPSVFVILPKTLLKWTTPHSKSATKFKAKFIRRQLLAENLVIVLVLTTTTTIPSAATTLVAFIAPINSSIEAKVTAFSRKQYLRQVIVECLAAPTSSSSSSSVSLCALVLFSITRFIHYPHHFIHDAVISKLAFLMNDIRFKSFYKPTITKRITTTTITKPIIALNVITTKIFEAIRTVLLGSELKENENESKNKQKTKQNNNNNNNNNNNQLILLTSLQPSAAAASTTTTTTTTTIPNEAISSITPILPPTNSKNNITVAALVILRLFNNSSFSSNNHRTYNNSSKSNKVFLHYTPRDPRLRIINRNQVILINKHHFDSVSELKITEDLCAYGELIGGSSSTSSKQQFVSGNLVYCDCNQIICCCNRNNCKNSECIENNLIVSESSRRKIIDDKFPQKLELKVTKEPAINQRQDSLISKVIFVRNLQLRLEYFKTAITTVGILL